MLVISAKTMCSQDVTKNSRELNFYMKITLISSNLVTNLFYSFFFLLEKTQIRMKFSASWWSGNKKYFCFLYSKPCCVKGMLSSIDFCKRIVLHVISVCTIVPLEYPISELEQSSLIQWIFSVGGASWTLTYARPS